MPGKNTNYQITTTLAIDGEKAFKAAMADANRAMRVHDADLKSMAAEYNYAGDQQRYFAQRAETTAEKVKQQEAIVEALNRAVKESADKYGDAAKQTDDYRIKLSKATAKMFDLRKEADNANRELEELGRDSGKIGRQIENGIGDAAEDTTGKLRKMFEQAAKDVNDLKNSVEFQTAMNVGGFVFDSIQSVMGFVQDNQEYNRRLAQARSVIESYGFVNEEIIEITKYAASITGNFETALEALVNLSGSGFESEEQMKATVQALLGGWVSAGGTMDFSGLAEDFLETVKTKTPSGLFAELVTKFTARTVEDVQKILESMTSEADVIEAATAILTEAGLQTKIKNYTAENDAIVKAEMQNIELAEKRAKLAEDMQETVEFVTNLMIGSVEAAINAVKWIEEQINKYPALKNTLQGYQNRAEEFSETGNIIDLFVEKTGTGELPEEYEVTQEMQREWQSISEQLKREMDNAAKNAGENLPEKQLKNVGLKAAQAIASGMTEVPEANNELAVAVQKTIEELYSETLQTDAKTGGKNLMTSFGNGIVEGMTAPLRNVQDMVAQIKAALGEIGMSGWPGISGGNIALYMDSQKVGQLTAGSVSTSIGRKVDTKMMVK